MTQRRLGQRQFAFVRSWAEGLDLPAAWDRYLDVDGHADARRARGELRRLLDELRTLARRHGRDDLAALLRRDPAAIADRGPPVPSLDEFRARLGPDAGDFYSEAELVELHRAEFGAAPAASPARRRQRLRERLVQAVGVLERLEPRDPAPADAAAAWLDPRIAARLAAVGVATLADLLARIERRGRSWHRGVPRIGPESAARLERWLAEHAASLGPLPAALARTRGAATGGPGSALPSPAAVGAPPADSGDASGTDPRTRRSAAPLSRSALPSPTAIAPRAGIVPFERFAAPAGLDGAAGRFRAPAERCRIAAANDYEAIAAWLRLRVEGTHTWRAYRKEAERLLLWAVLERGKALSSLDSDDCVAYRDFLAAPGPRWTGPRGAPRWSPDWRPFEGPLAPRSAATAITVVRSLAEWLVRRHYLDSNPWDDVPRRPDPPAMPRLRALSQHQWRLVEGWLGSLPPSPATRRLRFVVTLAYSTGLRLAELADARSDRLRLDMLDDGREAWSLMVLGKRAQWREVPLPAPVLEGFREVSADRGLPADPLAHPPGTPLIARLDRGEALSPARLYDILVEAFGRCADAVAVSDPRAAEWIREATTHWLRHTHGSHAAARGVPQDVLQANLGHRSLATTSIYVTAEKLRRQRAIEAAFGGAAPLNGSTAPAEPGTDAGDARAAPVR